MKRTLIRQEGEALHKWVERLTVYIVMEKPNAYALEEILHELSVESYFAGVHAEREMNKKYDHNNK